MAQHMHGKPLNILYTCVIFDEAYNPRGVNIMVIKHIEDHDLIIKLLDPVDHVILSIVHDLVFTLHKLDRLQSLLFFKVKVHTFKPLLVTYIRQRIRQQIL